MIMTDFNQKEKQEKDHETNEFWGFLVMMVIAMMPFPLKVGIGLHIVERDHDIAILVDVTINQFCESKS